MDDFEFIHMEEECSLEPPEAKPDTPTTTTQPAPSMIRMYFMRLLIFPFFFSFEKRPQNTVCILSHFFSANLKALHFWRQKMYYVRTRFYEETL